MRVYRRVNNLRVVRAFPGDRCYYVGNPWVVLNRDNNVVCKFSRRKSAERHAETDLTYAPGRGRWVVVLSSNLQGHDIKTFALNLSHANRLARYFVNKGGEGRGWVRMALVYNKKTRKHQFRIVRSSEEPDKAVFTDLHNRHR